MRLLIGTHNPGKLREYRDLLAGVPVEIVGLDDVGIDFEADETGDTFAANAEQKARAYAEASGLPALADDSGLCVDALDGGPGVKSARYGGPGLDDDGRRRRLLAELDTVPDDARGARFECVICVVDPASGTVLTATGTVHGRITREERDGPQGFGYDPVFVPEDRAQSFAEMGKDEKHALSHRGRAARNLLPELRRWLDNGA